MAQLDVTVAGRAYRLACEDGQEARLKSLCAQIDGETRQLAATMGGVGETRLLLMAALLFADRLAEATEALRRAEAPDDATPTDGADAPRAGAVAQPGFFDGADAAAALVAAVERLEAVVARRETDPPA